MSNNVGTASRWLQAVVDGAPRPLRRMGGHAGRYGYFWVAGSRRVLALEAPGGLDLPIGITVPGRVVTDALQSRRAFIGDGQLVTLSGSIRVAASRDDRLHLEITREEAEIAARAMMRELGAVARPDESQVVHDAVAAFRAPLSGNSPTRLETAAHDLVGLGLGSTPSGDDVIAGATATLSAMARSAGDLSTECHHMVSTLRRAIRRSCTRTTPLSAELMACAVHGYALQRLRRYVTFAVSGGDVGNATSELCATGHTSGYFLATGSALALRAVSTQYK